MLLTSGQVSVAISSAIVFTFTALLFLSGYILQQQTVRDLQAAIRPNLPKPLPQPKAAPTLVNPNSRAARPVGHRSGLADIPESEAQIDWAKRAYVQLVKDHVEVCSAVMLFAELHEMKSPAKRILMFPRAWLAETTAGAADPNWSTSKRLLRLAARRYRAVLRPISPMSEGADETLPSSYSTASIFTQIDFTHLLYIHTPGLLFTSAPFDTILAFPPDQSFAALPTPGTSDEISASLLLVHPSSERFANLSSSQAQHPTSDLGLLRRVFPAPGSFLPRIFGVPEELVAESSMLRHVANVFNGTEYLDRTAFVRLSDPEIPGPDYDIPYLDKLKLRPKEVEARVVWERLYETYRRKRMDVCGVDLETWYSPVLAS